MAHIIDPSLSVTQAEIMKFLDDLLRERANRPIEEQMADMSGNVITAIKHVMCEFEPNETPMEMCSRLSWVD